MEKNKKKKIEFNKKIVKNKSNVLNEDTAEYMLSLGFSIDQIYKAFTVYKFQTIEEAIQIMMKDPETKWFLHKYMESNNNCAICGFKQNDHLDYEDKTNEEEVHFRVSGNYYNTESNLNDRYGIKKNLATSRNNIDVPEKTLDEFEDPNICRICFNSKLNIDPKVTFSCNHEFCKFCVNNYLINNIKNGNVIHIKCLYAGCPRKFTNEEIKNNLDEGHWNKYTKFYNQKIKLNYSEASVMNCPFPDCDEIVEIDKMEVRKFVKCEREHKFCSKCKKLNWHNDGRCEKYDNNLLRQIQNGKNNNIYKQCPKCRAIIEKNEGCNQMKCINCDFEFCWICVKQYSSDHYAIYNFTASGPKKNSCLENKCIKCLWFILSCFLGFLMVILILSFFFFFGCAYEFIKCYLTKNKSENDEDHNDSSSIDEVEDVESPEENITQEDKQFTVGKAVICIFLGLIGMFLQPVYLLFYLMYGMMECYRRFGCWIFYTSY